MVLFIIKNRRLLRFQLKKKNIDWNEKASILQFRQECEKGARRFGKIPAGIEVTPVTIDGIDAEWILPSQTPKDKVIFFFHGGGYVSGSCSDNRIHVTKFVKGSNVGALLFEYRLAPEHPFPAALDDSVKAYRWLLARDVLPSDIVFAGVSAGGGLCLATLLALKDQGIPLPSAAVAVSPWTDLKCSGESYRTNAKKCLSPEGSSAAFSKHYVGDHDPGDPWISPIYGDLHGLPPMLIYVAGSEILYDDSVSFAQKAKDAGVDVTLRVGEGLFHCFPLCAPLFPEATHAMDDIYRFIKMHLRRDNNLHNRADATDAKNGWPD
jgi:acetyl esterase/lipase